MINNVDLFNQIVNDMSELYSKKNNDYGNSFEETANEFGLVAPVIRISDKLNRLKSLLKRPQLVKESIEDTLLDMANYAIMTVIWLRNNDLSSK